MVRYVNYLWNCCCMLETYKCYHPLSMLLILSAVNVLTQGIYVTTITTPVPSSTCIAIDDAILVICFIPATSYEVTTILILAIISLATNTTPVVINCLIINANHGVIIVVIMLITSLFSCSFHIRANWFGTHRFHLFSLLRLVSCLTCLILLNSLCLTLLSVLLLLTLECTAFWIDFLFFVHMNPSPLRFFSEDVLGL